MSTQSICVPRFHGSFIYKAKNWKQPKCPNVNVHQQANGQTALVLYGILFSNKIDELKSTCNNMGNSCKHWVNEVLHKRLHAVKFHLHDILELAKYMVLEVQRVISFVGGQAEGSRQTSLGRAGNVPFLQSSAGHGCVHFVKIYQPAYYDIFPI